MDALMVDKRELLKAEKKVILCFEMWVCKLAVLLVHKMVDKLVFAKVAVSAYSLVLHWADQSGNIRVDDLVFLLAVGTDA